MSGSADGAGVGDRDLVSCVMATSHRPGFLDHAVRCFLAQRMVRSELVIVGEEGRDPPAALRDGEGRVRFVCCPPGTLLGDRLNLGVSRAAGGIVQKLDDDDYYHPAFLAHMVALQARAGPSTIAALGSFRVFLAATGRLHRSGPGWRAGGTLCFRRSLWEAVPFRSLPRAVDWHFLQDHGGRCVTSDAEHLYVHVRHGRGHTWTRVGEADVEAFFAACPEAGVRLEECVPTAHAAFCRSLRMPPRLAQGPAVHES